MFPSLRADCARCAAVCCVALSFDRSLGFPIDKPAGQRCPHLDGAARCSIHQSRERRGFAGCVRYDCLGAGQRVTAELELTPGWWSRRDDRTRVLEAFARVRLTHQLLEFLVAAEELDLTHPQEEQRRAWVERVLRSCGDSTLEAAVLEFLRGLGAVRR